MVHTYTQNSYHIAVDGNSGSIHVLNDLTYDILKDRQSLPPIEEIKSELSGKYRSEDITEAYEEIQTLINRDMLFSTEESLEEVANSKQMNTSVKSLCLHVAHDCNLRCEYCFASKGDYNSGRTLMSREVALKAVDYLVSHSTGRHYIEIDFFGGEPLMNFDVVKEVVAYGRKIEEEKDKRFYFTITTNGTLLNQERIDFINENMDNVVISIDGRKEVHDAVRHDRFGRGSYDKVMPAAQKLVAKRNGKSYFIRGTFTTKNKDFSKDVMHLADMGFKEISVEPVVGSGSNLYFTESDIPDLLEEYDNLAKQYIARIAANRAFRFYHFNIDIYGGPCIFKRIAACGAGYEYLAVSPDGKLFPCHQFVGHDDFAIGDIEHGITNTTLSDRFRKNNIFAKQKCRDCWAKLFCAGGCHANAYFTNGSIDQPNDLSCTLQKKRIECALMIQAWKADKGI
ncbi:thioether cross-link-forming SCIFF peptide maturase [Caproicibacter fermentans]|uniref:Thioether cross-link-forming SCIFF peptide maturase n=1 Tax=Caproicibacter fermentans TaxID=2576756 RepID=A0A7G8T8H4_9FIRM|nr:thioether cross-link-forming SCIFF peptide maturase [Caproicibacter fermentans]QNK39915.1 thioether cross-link-forming SCIFF peptide maturase [Caproicibacter fermentans]